MWPLFGLKVRCDSLELRYPDEADVLALGEVAREGIHGENEMPFSIPWSDVAPEERGRSVLQWHWRVRGEWTPEAWQLALVLAEEGEIVGNQVMRTTDFAVTRSAETASWLGRRHQGRGLGTAMRRMMAHLAFAGLGATEVRSGAFLDNPASRRVSEKLGYREDGTEILNRQGRPAVITRYVLRRDDWAPGPGMEIEGLEACRGLFGVQVSDAAADGVVERH